MQHAERVQDDEYEKEGIRDFALWKSWKPDDGDIFWETSLGKGRPGWHIECSAMSTRHLGNHFDIHTGGVDNIFPHHENEIAQSKAATGEEFVNYWLHCEHLIVEGQKMSKSLGNFFNLRDVLDRDYSAEAIRYVLLSTHYRQKLNFTWDKLDEAQAAIERLRSAARRLEQVSKDGDLSVDDFVAEAAENFEAALDDDLNIAGALGHVFSLVKEANTLLDAGEMTQSAASSIREQLEQFDTILDVLVPAEESPEIPMDILRMVEERQEARKAKNYEKADALRDTIEQRGYEVEDTPQGPVVKEK
jgi:cysteinyl-tRNA synthetase